MFEKVQSLPENNGNSCLMTAACHALGSRPFVCPWSCSHRLEPDPGAVPGLARTRHRATGMDTAWPELQASGRG